MNQCMIFAVLVKCYLVGTQKPKPKFFANSYIFHNASHFDLGKKNFVIYIVWFLQKRRTNHFLDIILAQVLLQILKNVA